MQRGMRGQVCVTVRNLELRKLISYEWLLSNLPYICPVRRHYFYFPNLKTNLPSDLEEGTISIFQGCLLYQHLWINSLRKNYQCLFIRSAEIQKTYDELFPDIIH